jgi:hypothetical protein
LYAWAWAAGTDNSPASSRSDKRSVLISMRII